MAILYSDLGTIQAGGANVLASLNDPNFQRGALKLITAKYTMTGSEAANDLIYISRIPAGALVNPVNSFASTDGVASTATVSIGDTDTVGGTVSASATRYSAALNLASATTLVFSGGDVVTAPVETTDDGAWIVAKFASLATPSAGKVIVFRIEVVQLD